MDYREVSELLTMWHLPQLCQKFQAEEICINALLYLTEQDICELIPKIGPRAIFRAALQVWKKKQRQPQIMHKYNEKSLADDAHVNAINRQDLDNKVQEVMPQPMLVKLEANDEDEHNPPMTMATWVTRHPIADTTPSDFATTDEDDSVDFDMHAKWLPPDILNNDNPETTADTDTELAKMLNVREILQATFEGRKALKFYSVNKILDVTHRRRIVKAVICAAIERKCRISGSQFINLAEQFVREFPSENLDTYYIPRAGTICPRGALYNKYLNMCRNLRRDGLLDYHIQRRLTTSKQSDNK